MKAKNLLKKASVAGLFVFLAIGTIACSGKNDPNRETVTHSDVQQTAENESEEVFATRKSIGKEGRCGDFATWSFDAKSGVLTIEGHGRMYVAYEKSYWENISASIKEVVIPEGITVVDGFADCENLSKVVIPKSATEIGSNAFENCVSLKEITIPNKVVMIGTHAFNGCTGLTEITIPPNVTKIDSYAFYNCSNLKKINISNGVKEIHTRAFANCVALESVSIPESVSMFGLSVFGCCTALKKIIVDPNNQYYMNDEYGVLYSKDKTVLVKYPTGNERKSYSMSDKVERLESGAFTGCANLETLDISENIMFLQYGDFEKSGLIDEKNWRNGVLYIDNCLIKVDESFSGKLSIKNGTRIVVDAAFNNCSKITGIEIPDSVVAMECSDLYTCEHLRFISVGKNLKSFCGHSEGVNKAFIYQQEKFPDSLETIWVSEENQYFSSDEYGVLYDKNKTVIICYPLSSTVTDYKVADGVKYIYGMLNYAKNLEQITIGKNVEHITLGTPGSEQGDAFSGCNKLKKIIVSEQNKSFSSDSHGVLFNKNKTSILIYPPGNESAEYVVPDTVKTIEGLTFFGSLYLKRLYIGKNVENIKGGWDSFPYPERRDGVERSFDIYYAGSKEKWIEIIRYEGENVHYNTRNFPEVTEPPTTTKKSNGSSIDIFDWF